MQMERPSSIAMPAPWYSMTSDISWINRESNTPTPTSENPTASFGTLGFSAASEKDPIFTWDHPQIHQSKQQQQLHSKGPLEEQEEQEEEEEEVAWSAASLQSSFSGQIHDPCGDLYAPDESDEEPDFVAPLPSQWSHNMRRSSSCYYASESSEPSRLLHGTSGGAGMSVHDDFIFFWSDR